MVAIIAALPGIVTAMQQRQRERAEATEAISGAAVALIDSYRQHACELDVEVAQLKQRVRRLEEALAEKSEVVKGAWRLYRQVERLGGDPVYFPPKPEDEENDEEV